MARPPNPDGPAWRRLLDDPEARRWFDKLAMQSEGTAEERARVLHRYCEAVSATPHELAKKAQAKKGRREVENELQAFVIARHKEGKSSGYIENYVKAVRSWLRHNDVALVQKIAVGDSGATRVENERVPTPEELRGVLAATDIRGRVIVAVLGFSGVRPEVLGERKAKDGLRLADLPDLTIEGDTVRIKKVPMRVVVRRELSKVRRRYSTFLAGEGVEYLAAYLEHRQARGERLTPESPVVRPEPGFDRKGRPEELRGVPFLQRQAITAVVREAFRAQGIAARPYVLRSYFESALASAEREGKITQLDREFFAGRKGAIDARYTVLKELSAPTIEEMRREYGACEPYLTTRPTKPTAVTDLKDVATFISTMAQMPEVKRHLEKMGVRLSIAP